MNKFYIALFLLYSSICYSQSPCPGLDSLNYGGQWYHTVQIGSQCWLKENLNIGIMKPAVKDQINNDTIEKFCYNNDPSMCDVNGGLYQWREAMQYVLKDKARGICPIGWHVPSNTDFDTLISAVHGDGNSLKKIGQGGGTNTSGFSSMLSGINEFTSFAGLGSSAYFWNCNTTHIQRYTNILFAGDVTIQGDSYISTKWDTFNVAFGLNIRCIKDNDSLLLQSPFGGEIWQIGSIHNIAWGGKDLPNTKIKIEFTTDNGISWHYILESTLAEDGFYPWTVPGTPSKNCKVRITDLNNANINSISDTVFSIYNSCPGGSTIEHCGNIYHTVVMGSQCWFKENLNIGTMIPGNQTPSINGVIEKYCYDDDTANCTKFGGLYSPREFGEPGICPTGWHTGIMTYLIETVYYNGNSLKEIGQGSGFGSGTNISGFSALLAGRRNYDGTFSQLGSAAWFPEAGYDPPFYATLLDSSTSNAWSSDEFGSGGAGSLRCVNDSLDTSLPVELTSFSALIINNNVKVNWKTATETNTLTFEVEKKATTDNNWHIISSIKASGNSSSPIHYSYIDKDVISGKYSYRLKMIDLNGSFKYSDIVNIGVTPPLKFELANAFPNPWNPTTTIRYQVPINVLVTIKVFDALGKEITTLVNEVKPAGIYEITLNGKNLSSGVYYYQMQAGSFFETKKFILIK